MEIDYGLALDFVDTDGRPYQLRFRRNDHFSDTGQLIAVIATYGHPDNGHTIAISRPGVLFGEVEAAVDGWQQWARIDGHRVDLDLIRRRVAAAGFA